MSRSLQFFNIIDGGMSVYKDLFAQKKKERQRLPFSMFFSRKDTHASWVFRNITPAKNEGSLIWKEEEKEERSLY